MWRISVALVAFVAFGCTTVRAPASQLGDQLGPVSGAIAEPQVELWVESGKAIPEPELQQAREQVRAALGAALAGREVSKDALGAADPLLLLRARAVARTASRRSDQRAATVGIIVGAVVIVAAIVVIAVTSRKAPSAPRTATAAKPASAAPAPAPRLTIPARPSPGVRGATALAPAAGAAARARPSAGSAIRGVPAPAGSGRPVPSPGGAFRPAPSRGTAFPTAVAPAPAWPYGYGPSYGPHVWFGFDFVWVVPPPCCVVAEPYPTSEPYPYGFSAEPPPPAGGQLAPAEPPQGEDEEDARFFAGELDGAAPEPQAPAQPVVSLAIPPPPELPLETRGFFAGDETVLEVDLFDHATGALLWTRVVRDDVDPRDAGEMTKLLDRALANQPWIRREAPVPAPERH